jgi:integrase
VETSPLLVGYVQHTSPLRPNTALFLNVLIDMKNNNKADSTINFTRKALMFLSKHVNISKPEAVKQFIAQMDRKNGYKHNLCVAYNHYCKFHQIQWTMPVYRNEEREIVPPRKDKILMLIAEASKTTSIKLQLSMETGLRPVELCRLIVKDFHIEERIITPLTAKRGNPRSLKISQQLATRIQEHMTKKNLKPTDKIFCGNSDDYGKHYRAMRNKLAEKINDPSIRAIRLYDLRHYFCTKKLYELQNPYTVMHLMGHKKLTTTQKYMHLLSLADEEWECQGAETKQQAIQLIEAGFQYVTTIEGIQLFKKRK